MVPGIFIERMSTRLAVVSVKGHMVKAYISTGIDISFLQEGSLCYLREASGTQRTTSYDLYSVYDGDTLVCIDAKEPLHVAKEWFQHRCQEEEGREDNVIEFLRSQTLMVVHGPMDSECIQVMGTSFVKDEVAYLPETPSKALRDRLQTLLGITRDTPHLLIVVCRDDAKAFSIKEEVDVEFTMLFRQVRDIGIPITVLRCVCDEDGMKAEKVIPFL
ncbi:MAG: DNA/RNA nuclease SfsA [Blautia sp.]|nr:DNA/RNA nuclease SfsA [Blautia sp.]